MDQRTGERLGAISAPLLDPDTGKVEGFFVRRPHFLHTEEVLLLSQDVMHIGQSVRVREADVLTAPEDVVRLRPLLKGKRSILGQTVRTDTGRKLGRCRDIQFDSTTFQTEGLFPRRFLQWGLPIPLSDVIEVKEKEILVKESLRQSPVEVAGKAPVFA